MGQVKARKPLERAYIPEYSLNAIATQNPTGGIRSVGPNYKTGQLCT